MPPSSASGRLLGRTTPCRRTRPPARTSRRDPKVSSRPPSPRGPPPRRGPWPLALGRLLGDAGQGRRPAQRISGGVLVELHETVGAPPVQVAGLVGAGRRRGHPPAGVRVTPRPGPGPRRTA